MEITQKTVVLGDEFDEDLRANLMDVLRGLGATMTQGDWSVAGSQELEVMKVVLRDHVITIEAETYIGLSITGPEADVIEIKSLLAQRQRPAADG